MVQYDVVIVNWNSGEYLEKCIRSIFKSKNIEELGQIIVIDNGSTDTSLETIEQSDKLKIVHNNVNKGFAAACNQGITLSQSDYVVMMNPDVEVYVDTLSESIQFMSQNQHIDIMGCMQVNETGMTVPSCARFPTPINFFYDSSGLSKLFPKLFLPATLMTDWDHKNSKIVDQIIGSYMFIRKRSLEKTGLFDEQFFVYYEELDLSKRLRNIGGISYYNHLIRVLHYGGGTTDKVKGYRLFLSLNSRLLYAKKHFTNFGYFITTISTYLIEPFTRIGFVLFKGKPDEIPEIYKGYKKLWQRKKFNEKKTDAIT